MARRHKVVDDATAERREGFFRRSRRAIRTIFVVLCILYVAVLIAARTAGFRDLVAERLERRLGMPIRIKTSHVNWRFDTTLGGFATESSKKSNEGSVRAKQVRLAWSVAGVLGGKGPALRSVELDDAAIVFAAKPGEAWAPAALAPLGDFLAKWLELDIDHPAAGGAGGKKDSEEAEEVAAAPDVEPPNVDKISVRMTGGRISWRESDKDVASVDGIELTSTPVELPNRRLIHRNLRVAHVANRAGPSMRNLHLEILETGDQRLVLVFNVERLSSSGHAGFP